MIGNNFSDQPDRSKIPAAHRPGPFNFPEFTRFKTASGLEVVFCENNKLPLVSVQMCINSSAIFDQEGKEGTANLVSELLLEGTTHRSSVQVADELEKLGVSYGAHADWNTIHLDMSLLSKNIEPALEIFSDIILNSSFPDSEVERIKTELRTERLRVVDNPRKVTQEKFSTELYSKFRYAVPLEGTAQSISQIKREDLLSFHQNYFTKANMVLIVVGAIKEQQVRTLAETNFSGLKDGKSHNLPKLTFTEIDKPQVSLVHKESAVQAELCLGHIGADRSDPDYYAMLLMNEVLGGYFLSRLNLNLREKRGLTYSIHSSFSFRLRTGPFCISAAVQADKCLEAINEILTELENIVFEKITEAELQSAAGYINGIFPVAFETADQIALGLANIVSFNLPDNYYRIFRDHILKVDATDIRRAAVNHLFPGNCRIVVTGDRHVLEEPLRKRFPVTVFDVHGNQV